MKKIGVYLLIVSLFLVGALVATGLVWYQLVMVPLRTEPAPEPQLEPVAPPAEISTSTSEANTPAAEPDIVLEAIERDDMQRSATSTPAIEEPISIPVERLTDTQRSLAETLGVVENGIITITPEAQACAETKLGVDRIAELLAGDTPSFMEGVTLVNCL